MAKRTSNLLYAFKRSWFPFALIGLLLLGIPGLLLFILNLFGREASVNRWLRDNFNLSYHIPIPTWGVLLLLLVPLAILVLYFLKLKRKPLSVPSTFLWRKSIEDLHVNSLFQWLRENILLLLQILAVIALIYGVMAFHLHGRTGEGKHYILMIDNSASMSATDVAPNRLEQARQEALREIDSYSDNDFGMVIAFNSTAEILQSYTNNRAELRRAVERIEQTQRPTRIDEALSLAESLANPVRSTEDAASRPENELPGKERTYVMPTGMSAAVHLFSDGRFPDVSESANLNARAAGNESLLGNLNLQYHMIGNPGPENADNVGLVVLNATRSDVDPGKVHVLARARNYRTEDVRTKIDLEVIVDGNLRGIPSKPLTIPARKVVTDDQPGKEDAVVRDSPGEGAVTFELSDLDERSSVVLHAKLADLHDKYALDDEAWLTVGSIRKARVLIVGPPNEVLEAFFDNEGTRDVATMKQLGPDDLDKSAYQQELRGGAYDLVIFDRCGPQREEDMPPANTFFIGHPPPPWKLNDLPKLKYPVIKGWLPNHPMLRYLTALYKVGIKEAFKLDKLPARTPKLIESDRETPLLLTLSRRSFTDLVMTFPIIDEQGDYNTDWPGETSFLLFLRNVLYTLGNISESTTDARVQPGQIKTLRPDDPVKRLTVTGPDRKTHELVHRDRDARTEFTFGDTDRVGVYEYTWGNGRQRYFTVNLLDSEESNIEPRRSIQIGNDRIPAGQEISQPREIWHWFALAALVVLLVEWYIYNRRIYI
ncbi:MAG TPA: VWA domain-containing protein [Gemmataceae bacterium]|nr:VWA domain-containing protein [Gemmataceae bacterium]